jgi:uncharacterized iron-regulated membrane protein
MTDSQQTAAGAAPAAASRIDAFYFAAWRWHFYAGLYVAPFLIMLATTGLIMLWVSATSELNGERTDVAITGDWLPVSTLAEAATAAIPGGTVTQYIEPRAPGKVALFNVATEADPVAVLVNPYSGEVVDSFVWGDNWYTFASEIHGTLLIGTTGDRLIEIAAGFGIVLIATGLYLWWPRGGTGWARVLVPNLAARGRAFWKSLHQTIGFWVSAMLLVFLASGLSWAGIWGDTFVKAWNTFPAEKWEAPLSDLTHADLNPHAEHEVPWTLEDTPLPASGSEVGTQVIPGPVTLDTAVAYARSLGFTGRFQLNLPADETGVWTISHDSMSNDGPNPAADRTIHIDQYTGKVLADVGYADYSAYARMMAWGIAFHEGDMGNWNLALNTAFCLSVIFIAASGVVMWWLRRPAGARRLAAPPMPTNMPLWKGAVLVGLFVSMAFPLVGLTLIAVLALDVLVISRLPALKRAVS